MRTWVVLVGLSLVSGNGVAHASEPASGGGPPPEEVVDEEVAAPADAPLRLDPPPNFGFGIEGYAGIAAQITSGEDRAHALVGALARLRYHYVQLGGTFESTDSGQADDLGENRLERWRAFGGFVGVMLPYHHWVDLDASLGVSARNYANSSPIYGDHGLSKTLTALSFRIGVSDRMTHKLAAPRIGAAIAFTADLSHTDAEWHRQILSGGSVTDVTGTVNLGGFSIALLVSAGFELGARPH